MNFEYRGELRADPGIAPGSRNVAAPRRRSVWPSIAVVAAIAAFGGVIWYAYRTAHNSGESGLPPLVKAEPGPAKIKPDQPGGQEIPFQDSTVYDHLNRNGPKPVMEKLLPPPEVPVARPLPVAQAQPSAAAPPSSLAPPPPYDTGSPTALAPPPGAIVTPPSPKPPQSKSVVQKAALPSTAPGKLVAQPAPGPAKVLAGPKSPSAPVLVAPVSKPAVAASAGGVYRIQLSSVRSPEAVDAEWARMKHRFPDALGALKLISGKTELPGKGTFYRIQAGPLDAAGAKSACEHMKAQGGDCIVVKS